MNLRRSKTVNKLISPLWHIPNVEDSKGWIEYNFGKNHLTTKVKRKQHYGTKKDQQFNAIHDVPSSNGMITIDFATTTHSDKDGDNVTHCAFLPPKRWCFDQSHGGFQVGSNTILFDCTCRISFQGGKAIHSTCLGRQTSILPNYLFGNHSDNSMKKKKVEVKKILNNSMVA